MTSLLDSGWEFRGNLRSCYFNQDGQSDEDSQKHIYKHPGEACVSTGGYCCKRLVLNPSCDAEMTFSSDQCSIYLPSVWLWFTNRSLIARMDQCSSHTLLAPHDTQSFKHFSLLTTPNFPFGQVWNYWGTAASQSGLDDLNANTACKAKTTWVKQLKAPYVISEKGLKAE